jgi:hypothetical protein
MAERGIKAAKAHAPAKRKMRTREVRIRPAENGFTVSHDQEPADTPKKGDMLGYQPPTETVHETPESMLAHVGGIFGAKPAAPAAEPDGDEGAAGGEEEAE